MTVVATLKQQHRNVLAYVTEVSGRHRGSACTVPPASCSRDPRGSSCPSHSRLHLDGYVKSSSAGVKSAAHRSQWRIARRGTDLAEARRVEMAETHGRVQITYDEAGTKPENLHALRLMQQSGAFERVASWVNDRIALPSDIHVRVTDAVPTGVRDASAEADG